MQRALCLDPLDRKVIRGLLVLIAPCLGLLVLQVQRVILGLLVQKVPRVIQGLLA